VRVNLLLLLARTARTLLLKMVSGTTP